ncbi:hypothetical protein MKX01_000961 [Papaver californicum]|nr:hypothetical protein MKX01_000961 [Papaver californicum]
MAEDTQYSTRTTDNNKRKHEDYHQQHDRSPPSYSSRRPSGFSAPIIDSTQQNPNNSYNPSPGDDFQQAKQRAQEIAARIYNTAEAKRPRFENGDGWNDEPNDYGQKQQPPISYGGGMNMASSTVPTSYGSSQGGSRKIEIPNGKVGVIIGRGGDKIKNLQLMSGAKIQITRDMEADRNAPTRGVELTGTPDQINRAEQLINEALAEVDTEGGSGAAPRRFTGQPGAVQFQMKVANNKVGLVIGKGGETIKNMQASSGARIQVIPLHPPPGDTSTERTVYIDGTPEQIEYAKQLVNEVISENRVRNPPMGGGYPPQQGYRPPSWGPPGAPPVQQTGYGYVQQPGAYPSQAPQGSNASQPSYPGYPPQPTSGGYSSGWDQTSGQTNPQGSGTGYDYYSQQPQSGTSTTTDPTGYGYGHTATYSQQHVGSYGDSGYAQPPGGQQQGYADMYGAYPLPAPQPGYGSQIGAQPGYGGSQAGYDQSQQSYGSSAKGGGIPPYGAQGATEVPPPTSQVASVQPPTSAGIGSQQLNTPPSYPPQGSIQTSYGSQPAPPPVAQVGYGPPQGQKAAYGQTPPPSSTQTGSIQSAAMQPGYAPPPTQSGYAQQDSAQYRIPSGYGSAPGYGQAPPYGAPQPAAQPGYGQAPTYGAPQPATQPGYGQSYDSKVPSYSSDSNVGSAAQKSNSNDTTQASQSGQVDKASPKS